LYAVNEEIDKKTQKPVIALVAVADRDTLQKQLQFMTAQIPEPPKPPSSSPKPPKLVGTLPVQINTSERKFAIRLSGIVKDFDTSTLSKKVDGEDVEIPNVLSIQSFKAVDQITEVVFQLSSNLDPGLYMIDISGVFQNEWMDKPLQFTLPLDLNVSENLQ
jgi:hypothetical protein